ncbi:MAG TPA: ABC transporter ATP-binding protein [Ideonella sp.]|uniref:ABC transporter ATP-binding protein n=1 Tax=Ideonella sp. TaxID=1929293 RepID=UPI002D19A5EC|nr:ABC transporter ATP-binding protein [Ideonella sp.]HSI51177.1 ABC transporter ATP-binding protein [Ideonella sp.]
MLKIDELNVQLDAEAGLVQAIDQLTLCIERGETLALVGESGCGKSMTALALMRLLPDNGRLVAGSVMLDGADTLALPEQQMRAVRGGRIGMIFQEPSTSLNPVMRVGDQIVEAIEAHTSLRGAAARARALDWLRRVGIPEPERRIDDYPFRMSGGQKQRVMIAMTLAAEPDFLVADEPTTALDVTIQAQVLDLLRQLQAETGLGMLLITHDLAVVAGMAHRVALMYAGQIIETADAQSFFSAPRHPYAQALLRALPDAQRRGQALAAIPGTVPALTQSFHGCRFEPRCALAEAACAQTRPDLWAQPGTRSVRCVLYAPGREQTAPENAKEVAVAVAAVGAAVASPKAPEAANVVLDVQSLHVRYPIRGGLLQRVRGHFDAVGGISFQVRAGQTLALVGESGCGKTTTGKAIVQLLRRVATTQGRALLDGQDLFTMDALALQRARREVQIIFQDPYASLNPRMRVFDILEEGLLALQPDLDAMQRRARLLQLADQVGLRAEALARHPHEFSGGQRQRIAIARALAVQPRLIVCDEPTSALDVSVQAQILNLLRELQRDTGVAFLFITHNIGVVEYIADEVAVMQSGRIVEQGACEAVLQHPEHVYTRRLIDAVPRLNTAAKAVVAAK